MFRFTEDNAMDSDGGTSLALVPFDTGGVAGSSGSVAGTAGTHCFQIVPLPPLPSTSAEAEAAAGSASTKRKPGKPPKKEKETNKSSRSSRLKLRSTKGRKGKHTKSNSKAKPKSASKKAVKPGSRKRKRVAAILKETPAEDILQETSVVQSFRWPHHLMEAVLSCGGNYREQGLKPIHVQVFSEFSGAGTAEFSLQAIANAAPDTGLQCMSLTSSLFSMIFWFNHQVLMIFLTARPDFSYVHQMN